MIDIRPIGSENLPIITKLASRIWPVSYASILTQQQIENMLKRIYSPENLQNEMMSGHQFFLATLNDEHVGYTSGYQEDGALWLKKLYVLPDLQGHGIGKQLMQKLIEAFTSAREIRLLVNRDNHPAQLFYEKQGFIKIDEVPVQMGDFAFVDLVFSKKLYSTAA